MSKDFFTMKGYQLQEKERESNLWDGERGAEEADHLTTAMEDYLEMICRVVKAGKKVKVREIADALNVKPSSASKMLQKLGDMAYLEVKKYGIIKVTEKGENTGSYLLHRHQVVNNFLCALNGTEDELTQTEKIEHFLEKRTVENMEKFTKSLLIFRG